MIMSMSFRHPGSALEWRAGGAFCQAKSTRLILVALVFLFSFCACPPSSAENKNPSRTVALPRVQERHADCAPSASVAKLRAAKIQKIIDGDTFSLGSGERVRLIGINAPEIRRRRKPGEPLGEEAKKAAQRFFGHDLRVYLETGTDERDRYNRILAHAYRADGAALEVFLLERGLALQILVPPNIAHRVCLTAAESRARHAKRGIWDSAYFAPRPAARLKAKDTGFRRVVGTVVSATKTKGQWWLELDGPVVLRLTAALAASFGYNAPADMKGLQIGARGWLTDRSGSRAVQRGFKPLVLNTVYLTPMSR